MVILLDGTSQVARVTIAERAAAENPAWKHLALEVFEESAADIEEKDFHLQVIKRCAEELERSGLNLLLTMPADSPHRTMLAEALQPRCITVHLGSEDDGEFDFVIDPNTRSVNDVAAFLHALMTPETDEDE